MGFVFLLLVALVIWLYLWVKDLDKNSNPVKKYSHETQEECTRKLRAELTTQKLRLRKTSHFMPLITSLHHQRESRHHHQEESKC
jgi:hypothetical protein